MISLVGLMGCGKTKLGSYFSKKENLCFVDSDDMVEKNANLKITEIFQLYGEEKFRDCESRIIRHIILQQKTDVLALGGGAFTQELLHDFIKNNTLCIWLDSPVEKILTRISNFSKRPLLADSTNPLDTLTHLYQKRAPYYQKAHIRIELPNNDLNENALLLKNSIIDYLALNPWPCKQ